MSILSDIIVADRNEAASINAALGAHSKGWSCLASNGIDTIKLGTLSQILGGRPVDDVDAVSTFMVDDVLDQASEDGPWVFLIPAELQTALAILGEDKADSVAEKWASTEEFVLDRWQKEDVGEYLRDLVAHARKARDAGKSLLLWVSL